jgi:hypothetical protein
VKTADSREAREVCLGCTISRFPWSSIMADLSFVGLTVVLFAALAALIRAVERR